MKTSIALVCVCAFLGYKVFQLDSEVKQLQTNATIAVLSAEAANNKIGAIAPFFAHDKEAFAKAWLDSVNMPGAVFPEDVLVPLKRTLDERRMSNESQQQKAAIFRWKAALFVWTTFPADKLTETIALKEQYLREAQFALFGCQMVEETLKSTLMYVREINLIIPTEFIPIDKADDELDELPLGPLIKLYERAFPNSSVTLSLKALRPERNHCAHRALILCFMDVVKNDFSLQDEFSRVECIRKQAWLCFELLKADMQSAALRLDGVRTDSPTTKADLG